MASVIQSAKVKKVTGSGAAVILELRCEQKVITQTLGLMCVC